MPTTTSPATRATTAAPTTTRPTTTTTKPTTTTSPTTTTTAAAATTTATTTTQTTTTTKPTTTTTEPTTTTTSQTTTKTSPTTTTTSTTRMISSVPTTTTKVPPIRPEEVTTRPLSLLEQVMTRSVPFIKKRRRFTTPTSVESTTDGSKIEPIQTTSSYREPSSVMPRPNEHTTANPGLVTSRQESLRYDVEVAKSDIQATDEEDGDYRNTPTKSPLPKMSPELRMALVRELLKQMQATRQSNQKKTKVMPERKPTTQTYPTQMSVQEDDELPPDQTSKMPTMEEKAADISSSDQEEPEEDPPSIEEGPDEPAIDPEPPAQIGASQTDLEGSEQKMESNKVSNNLKVKVDTEVQTEAERIAALLKDDVPQTKTISLRQEPETSEESQEPVTPSAFLRALRERVKNRPSIRGSRKKTRPKPRRRGKIRKSLPRGPRPSTEDEEDEIEDVEDNNDEQISEKDPKHSEQPRAKLHQLVNAELNSQNDEESAEETDNQK
ncbi:cell wall protein DAN4-like [Amphibalanus amphitrite]|uniref:cell wall protein DAN4-like n=1 Tax=Amphibalanus amphitrite TaxID=1232801 RepID=UPI001C92AAE3|nr:cell wall protein DAN4-like [Amphibalanus amphitrite]